MPEATTGGKSRRRRSGAKKARRTKRKAASKAARAPKALRTKAARLGIRTTVGKSRKPKTPSVLRAQIAAKSHRKH